MKILGIDPGTATTGFGVVEWQNGTASYVAAGVIKTTPDTELPTRLLTIQRDMAHLLVEHKPDAVSVELLFFAANVTTAMAVSQARGVVLAAIADAGLPVHEYTPLQVKQALTGYGRADKKQMQEMVKNLLKLDDIPRPDDAADALAIAITHAHSMKGAHAKR